MASARGLKDELWYRYDINSFQSGLIVSASLFGALAGSSAAFVVGDKLGRRRELLLAAVLYGKLYGAEQAAVSLHSNLTRPDSRQLPAAPCPAVYKPVMAASSSRTARSCGLCITSEVVLPRNAEHMADNM